MNSISIEQVKRLAELLSPADKQHLAKFLNQQAGNITPRPKPQSLRGTWKDAFPPDLDAELKEIRSEWEMHSDEHY
ncbi:MAG: hypothetical protein JNM09_15755 [Blastocatellia bacterium]|nr:hypothetical protein [Blastocatellia bacterium]